MTCKVRVQGHLSTMWLDWIEGITISKLSVNESLLTGEICDQAMLLGLLNRLHALNVQIVSIDYKCSASTNATAVLSGRIGDQAALHGILIKIRDLGLPLLAVQRMDQH